MFGFAVFINGVAYASTRLESLTDASDIARGWMAIYPFDQDEVDEILSSIPEVYMSSTPLILFGGRGAIRFFLYEESDEGIYDFEYFSFFTRN